MAFTGKVHPYMVMCFIAAHYIRSRIYFCFCCTRACIVYAGKVQRVRVIIQIKSSNVFKKACMWNIPHEPGMYAQYTRVILLEKITPLYQQATSCNITLRYYIDVLLCKYNVYQVHVGKVPCVIVHVIFFYAEHTASFTCF